MNQKIKTSQNIYIINKFGKKKNNYNQKFIF